MQGFNYLIRSNSRGLGLKRGFIYESVDYTVFYNTDFNLCMLSRCWYTSVLLLNSLNEHVCVASHLRTHLTRNSYMQYHNMVSD